MKHKMLSLALLLGLLVPSVAAVEASPLRADDVFWQGDKKDDKDKDKDKGKGKGKGKDKDKDKTPKPPSGPPKSEDE